MFLFWRNLKQGSDASSEIGPVPADAKFSGKNPGFATMTESAGQQNFFNFSNKFIRCKSFYQAFYMGKHF